MIRWRFGRGLLFGHSVFSTKGQSSQFSIKKTEPFVAIKQLTLCAPAAQLAQPRWHCQWSFPQVLSPYNLTGLPDHVLLQFAIMFIKFSFKSRLLLYFDHSFMLPRLPGRLVLAPSQTVWPQICSVSTAQRLNSCCWVSSLNWIKYKVPHFV